jgi:hypothetical protein
VLLTEAASGAVRIPHQASAGVARAASERAGVVQSPPRFFAGEIDDVVRQ